MYSETTELITSYADEFTAAASSPKVEAAAEHLARHAKAVTDWAERRSLQVSAQKFTLTVLTSQTQQSHHHPRVPVNRSPLPLDRIPTIWGVTSDPHLFFHHHVDKKVKKAKPRLKLLRLLWGTSWGQQTETISANSKSLIGSVFTFQLQSGYWTSAQHP